MTIGASAKRDLGNAHQLGAKGEAHVHLGSQSVRQHNGSSKLGRDIHRTGEGAHNFVRSVNAVSTEFMTPLVRSLFVAALIAVLQNTDAMIPFPEPPPSLPKYRPTYDMRHAHTQLQDQKFYI